MILPAATTLFLLLSSSNAFTGNAPLSFSRGVTTTGAAIKITPLIAREITQNTPTFALRMAEDEASAEEKPSEETEVKAEETEVESEEKAEETEVEAEEAEAVAEETEAKAEEEDSAEEEEEVEEEESEADLELQALKDEISELETSLKNKRRSLNSKQKEAEEFTESGFKRKCAEMDNVNRKREMTFADDKTVSKASAVQNFLPVLDSLRELDVKFENTEFAKKYGALRSDYESVFKKMDVTEYTATVGEACDLRRMIAIREEYSDDIAKGSVIEELKGGVELKGNVITMAEVVSSMGSEADAAKEAEEKVQKKKDAKAKSEAVDVEVEAEDDVEAAEEEKK